MNQQPMDPAASEPDPVGRQLMHQALIIARLRNDLDAFASETTDILAGPRACAT